MEHLFNDKAFFELLVDRATGKIFEKEPDTARYSDKEIRDRLYEMIGVTGVEDKLFELRMQTHQREIMSLIVETLVATWPDFFNTPFMNRFVDYRSYRWGEKPVFEVDDMNLFVVSKVANGTWDTRRQKAYGKTDMVIDYSTYDVHIYGELFDFLSGRLDWGRLIDKLRRSIQFYNLQAIFAEFMSIGEMARPELTVSGSPSPLAIIRLCETIRGLTGAEPVIMGTMASLYNIMDNIKDYWLSPSMKDEINDTGALATWKGYEVAPIPTAITPGTFTLRPDNNRLFIMPRVNDSRNGRFIKVANAGTPLIRQNDMPQRNQDQTLDYQLQYMMGTAVIVNHHFGLVEFS